MHITITDEATGGIVGVLCVNRETQTCIVLQSDVEYLESLVQIGKAMKVPRVLLITPKDTIPELQSVGWAQDKTLVVMTRERN